MIEEREGSLNLIETTSRGSPAAQNTTNKRKARSFIVPHVALEDTILADEIQNLRAFGSESQLEGIQQTVQFRLAEMSRKHDATLEHLRVGAIKGQILDADGSTVLYDLFNEFGVTQYTEIDFDLDNASPVEGAVKKKCHDVRRKIEDEMLALAHIPENADGTNTLRLDSCNVKIVSRINRTVNSEKLQELAAENGLTDHLSSLFRWKPEINMELPPWM